MELVRTGVPTRLGRFVLSNLLLFGFLISHSQSVCPIGVGTEPKEGVENLSTSFVNEIFTTYFSRWANPKNIKYSEDKKALVSLSGMKWSRQLMGNNLKFQIPSGATINGVILSIEGQSNHYQNISEMEILLLGPDGQPKGENKGNTIKLQKPWSKTASGDDTMWMYGSSTDTWGTTWTAEDINNENFGYQIQLRNIDLDTINVAIDQVQLTVHYTPAYSFCDDKCLTFYIDKYEQKGSYVWDYPAGFNMVSASVSQQTIDLKIGDAPYGVYDICVDVYEKSGAFSETCCRKFSYQNCSSSEIKGLIWLDLNDNKLRENNEGTLSNVPLVLYTKDGIEVDTVLSDGFGKYHFKDLLVNQYYIKAPVLADKKMVPFDSSDPDINSDITNTFGIGTTNVIQTEIGKCVEGIDLGYTPLVSIGDLVWNDKNFNGLQDASELGIKDAKVTLYNGAGVKVDSLITNEMGHYKFDNLSANSYYLKFDIPQDFYPTFSNTSNTNLNSKINLAGVTPTYNLITSGFRDHIDAGFYQTARLGDLVWEDKNGNGIYNPGELPLANVKIKLKGVSGNGQMATDSTMTNANGIYHFDKAKPGIYTLSFDAPQHYFFTLTHEGGDETKDSDPINGSIVDLVVSGGDLNLSQDAGMYRLGSLSDLVWDDLNANGIQDANELGVEGVKVTLVEIRRDEIIQVGSRITDQNGHYIFENLKPGEYNLQFELPQSYTFSPSLQGNDPTKDNDVVDGFVKGIQLMSGENNNTYDAGIYRSGSLGNFVWEDTNANGIQDAGENGIANVGITLTGTTGNGTTINQMTTTDANGNYQFDNLTPGNYQLSINTPSGYNATSAKLGGNNEVDSDFENGQVTNIILVSGQITNTYDAGFFKFGSLGNFVWEDTNANGIQDAGENGIANIGITLTGTTGNGTTINQMTTTDANGNYQFDNLTPGNYQLSINTPLGYNATFSKLGGNNEVDSDFENGEVSNIILVSGQIANTYDAGFFKSGSLGNFVWEDTNANGIQDAGENGIANIGITLTGTTGNGTTINQMTTTDAIGNYQFTNLTPGNYQLNINTTAGYNATSAKLGGNNEVDSDFENGEVSNIILVSGQITNTYDAGFFKFGSLGNFVWEDTNANGIQDAGEKGIANIGITLTGTTGNGTVINQMTTTDANGNYQFTNLTPGNYQLNINTPSGYNATRAKLGGNNEVDSDFENGQVSNIILVSGQIANTYDAGFFKSGSLGNFVWEDTNANGIQDNGENGIANVSITLTGTTGNATTINQMATTDANGNYQFTNLTPGNYQIHVVQPVGYSPTLALQGNNRNIDSNVDGTDITVNSGDNDQSIDFGYLGGVAIGDFVWEDLNTNGMQDAGEPGLQNIIITLSGTSSNGLPVSSSTTTDINGKYSFVNVFPGNYQLKVELPTSYSPTRAMTGSDRETDSNLSENSNIFSFDLVNNTSDLSLDFGMVKLGSIGDMVWEDLNCNGVFQAGEPGLANVSIHLDGVDLFNSLVNLSTKTDQNGHYLFDNLKPGRYNITFDIPQGYEFSAAMVNIVDLQSGQDILNIDAPLYKKASIGNFVWNDTDSDGIQDDGEPGISGLVVTLTSTSFVDNITLQTTTDQNGNYLFDQLKPGTYSLKLNIPSVFVASPPLQGNNADKDSNIDALGMIQQIVLISGQNDLSLDAGLISTSNASLGDFVWEDLNANGIQETNEPGIANVIVQLSGTDLAGNQVNQQTNTDAAGHYHFNDLPGGQIELTFVKTSEYYFTEKNVGNTDLDSDADPVTGKSEVINIGPSDQITNLDAGLYRLGTIGDLVWNDNNKNGLKDNGELGIADVHLTLLDGNGSIVKTSTSSNTGFYQFSDIKPGEYKVEAEIPSGFLLTTAKAGNDDIDSDFSLTNGKALTDVIVISSNTTSSNIDLGLRRAINSISGYTWFDENGDGINETVETVMDSIVVYLLNTNGDTIATDTTDLQGMYTFTPILDGSYTVRFQLIDSLQFTIPNRSSDPLLDSDVALADIGSTSTITLVNGQDVVGTNAGYSTYGSIGDFVWVDENENRTQDSNEVGLNGINISLFDQNNNVIKTTISSLKNGKSGYYHFDHLAYGTYYLSFSLPQNFAYSLDNGVSMDANSDIIDNTGKTSPFELSPGQNLDNIDAGYIIVAPVTGNIQGLVWQDGNNSKLRESNESPLSGVGVTLHKLDGSQVASTTSAIDGTYQFLDIPFGDYYIKGATIQDYIYVLYGGTPRINDSDINNDFGQGSTHIISLFPGTTVDSIDLGYTRTMTIGDFVWDDANNNGLQDNGEPGMNNVMITLYNEQGVIERTTTSTSSGSYSFANVPVGKFSLKFQKISGFVFALSNSSNQNLNSKADSKGVVPLTDFSISQIYSNIDVGYVKGGRIGDNVWLDINGNGIMQSTEPGISGINIKLFTSAGVLVDSTKSAPNLAISDFIGYYQFVDVRPGDYYIKFYFDTTYIVTPALIGDVNTDNNISNANGLNTTDVFSVGINQTINNIDAGAYIPASLGDRVWNDLNKNGVQDAGEPGVPNITVNLFTQAGSLLATTMTDADGYYLFGGLRQRLYYLQFSLPNGFQFTGQYTSGDGNTDSDVDPTGTTPLISLAHGSKLFTIDAGVFVTTNRVVMGNIWADMNQDGLRSDGEPLQNNINVYLMDINKDPMLTTKTNHAGMYAFVSQISGEHYISMEAPANNVFTSKNNVGQPNKDSDVDENGESDMIMFDNNYAMKYVDGGFYFKITTSLKGVAWQDENLNGVRDGSDVLLANVVILVFNQNRIFIKSTVTDENGNYQFSKFSPGQYYCKIQEFEDKDYVLFTGANQDIDSEITNQYGTGTSRLVTLEGNIPTTNFDFGYKQKGKKSTNFTEVKPVDLEVYPNPTLSYINVINPTSFVAEYRIYNNLGALIHKGMVESGITKLDVELLQSGNYFIQLQNKEIKVTKSFLKMDNW